VLFGSAQQCALTFNLLYMYAAVSTVPNAKVEVLGPEDVRVSWDPVLPGMASPGILLGYKIHYQSDGELERTIILVEHVVEHVIPALSESTICSQHYLSMWPHTALN